MAENWGGQVRNWRGGVNAWIINEYDTYVVIRVEARWQSIGWGFNVPNGNQAYINCDGQNTDWVNVGGVYAGTGQTVTRVMLSRDFTVQKPQGEDRYVWVAAGVRLTGYQPGMSDAGVNILVKSRTYYTPRPPKEFTARRVSDDEQVLGWKGDYTGMDDYWPWGNVYVDRRTDDGSWQTIATLGWDAVNYTDRTTTAGHKYEYGVRSTGPGGTSERVTAAAIFTTPPAVQSVSLAKQANTSVRVGIEGAPRYVDYYNLQQSVNGGAWGGSERVDSFPTTLDVSGSLKVRVQAVKGTLAGPWRESGTVTTIVAPNAPTISTKPAGVVAVGTQLRYGWDRNHPDGSAQTAAQLGYTVGGGAEKVVDIQGAESAYTLPAEVSSKAQTVKVRVRTKGVHADWGAWSAYVTTTVAVPPTAHFTTPATDGAKVGDLPLIVAWEVVDSTGIASQRLELLDEGGRVLHSATPGNDTRRYTLGDQTYRLANATAYRLRLTVRGGSSLTVTTERAFATSFAEPARPTATVATDPAKLSQTITVSAGAPFSEEAGIVAVDATPGTLVPGLTVFGSTRQNLWINPVGKAAGVTVVENADGSVTVSGVSTASGNTGIYVDSHTLIPGKNYHCHLDKPVEGASGILPSFFIGNGEQNTHFKNSSPFVFTFPSGRDNTRCGFYFGPGQTVSGTYRIILREATPEEVAEAASTPMTMQEGGTADLPTYHVMPLPLYEDRAADAAQAFDWVRPGINGAQPTAVNVSGKNLVPLELSTSPTNGEVTYSIDGDKIVARSTGPTGYSRVLFRATQLAGQRIYLGVENILKSTPNLPVNMQVAYTVNGERKLFGVRLGREEAFDVPPSASSIQIEFMINNSNSQIGGTATFVKPYVSLVKGTGFSAFGKNESVQIDLKGHQLHRLPDGTRDELHIDGTGTVTLVQRVGDIASYNGEPIGDVWLSSALDADGRPSKGARVVYKLDAPTEVTLDGITMPEFTAARSQLWASSMVPCTMRVDYPQIDGLSVTRVLADGSRWLVARGLGPGQQAIDPLPPLNTDYDYEVVASTEAGAESETVMRQHIETRGRMALNFGRAAATAFIFGQNASVSESVERRGELYHFADADERGGLPLWYPSGDVDVSGDVGFELRDRDERDRFAAIARKFSIGWFRDAMGGRKVARMRFDERIDAGGAATWEETVKMDEAVFEEAW